MRKKGKVSLWLGKTDSNEQLDTLLEIDYTDDEDSAPSKFASFFDMEQYDDDFREASFFENPHLSLEKVLEGFSYDDVIIPRFSKYTCSRAITDYNTIILLYNFEYNGKIKYIDDENGYIEFIGTADYE